MIDYLHGNPFLYKIMGNYIKNEGSLSFQLEWSKCEYISGLHELLHFACKVITSIYKPSKKIRLNSVALLLPTTGVCNMATTHNTRFPNVFICESHLIEMQRHAIGEWRSIEFNRYIICVVTLELKYIFSKNYKLSIKGLVNQMRWVFLLAKLLCCMQIWLLAVMAVISACALEIVKTISQISQMNKKTHEKNWKKETINPKWIGFENNIHTKITYQ